MKIAVIGNYQEKEQYELLLAQTRAQYREEQVLDLSEYHCDDYIKERELRTEQIKGADLVIVGKSWPEHITSRTDLTTAQRLYKEIIYKN